MFSTQVLPELQSVNDLEEEKEEDISGVVGFIIVDDVKFEVKKGETKIGRDSSMCSIVIENFTISKVHAVIESEGIDETFIYDVGSTNQTKLKKKVLKPHCRYKLDNESKLIFGNVSAKFVLPSDKGSDSNITPNKHNSGNLNSVDEFGDIFDVATQVTALQSSTSNETFIFEKHKGNFPVFKIPNSVFSAGTEKSVESLKNCFEEMKQCRLDFEEKTLRTVSNYNSFEKSDIFSLSTQCQIYENAITEKNKCEAKTVPCNDNHKNSESNKVKYLLNDGEDDVLCTFMSLHSPKGKINDKSLMKVKTEVINLSQELNAPTQIQAETVQEPSADYKIEMKELSENKDLNIDFFSKSLCQPRIMSTPLNKKLKLDHLDHVSEDKDGFTELIEEDFVITQEFNADGLNSVKKYTNASHDLVSLSQNEETQLYLRNTLGDFSTKEKKNINEDLILTQTFEFSEKTYQNKETLEIISESDDLIKKNFTSAQINYFENEKQGIKEKSSSKENALLPGNSNKNVESHLDETLDFTQRNNENDFISTQIFEGTTNPRKENESLNKSDSYNDEDFISTQLVQLPLIKVRNSRSPQERTVDVKASSKESSPDLLGLEDTWKTSEDCIATQKFENPECRNLETSLTKFTLQTDSYLSSLVETEKYDCKIVPNEVPKIIDSSGDETESDLEILFDSDEKRKDRKSLEYSLKSLKADSEFENSVQLEKSVTPENDSNSSYIFELKPENHVENGINVEPSTRLEAEESDSNATDCEELAVMCMKFPEKEKSPNKTEIEENQMTLKSSHDFTEKNSCSNNDWMDDKESPKFEIGRENSPLSPLSLQMPNTQEIETTISNLLRNESEKNQDFQKPLKIIKNEVGIKNLEGNTTINKSNFSETQVDSLLKRPLDNNTADIVPLKKPKNETLDKLFRNSDKQFSKLVKTHDIAQIQPNRTRNSIKMLTTENNVNKADISLGNNITNDRPTSRRKTSGKRRSTKKPNANITPYLSTKKLESRKSSFGGRKEISPSENNLELKPSESNIRILRSSKRNNGISVSLLISESPTQIWKSKKIYRTKSEEYFSDPCVNIIFTGFECESLDKIIHDLGGKKTNDLSLGEVVVADKVRRTVKFLCAIGLSLPITSPQWLMSCKKRKKFLNPWNFILKDEESEEKWNFELKASLEKSRKLKLLQGFNVFATKSTKPPMKDLLAIVECCGGTPLSSPPDVWPKNTIIVTCLEDKKLWPHAKFRNVRVVHYEFILSGVLRQKIDFKTYRLR